MSAHTEGPWERVDTPDYAEIHPKAGRLSQAIALVGKPEDADLIEAAPEMKTALARQLAWLLAIQPEVDNVLGPPISNGLSISITSIRAALARAEGRHP